MTIIFLLYELIQSVTFNLNAAKLFIIVSPTLDVSDSLKSRICLLSVLLGHEARLLFVFLLYFWYYSTLT